MSRRIDKGAALVKFLEDRGARFSATRAGYQKISCINEAGHPRGDRNPSASINLTTGYYRCFACDLSGDAIDLIQALDGLTYSAALTTLGGAKTTSSEEPVWL
jgi:hypothetical protein